MSEYLNGEFELTIPKQENVILEINLGCFGFTKYLIEVEAEEQNIDFEIFTKASQRRSKKILRKLNR